MYIFDFNDSIQHFCGNRESPSAFYVYQNRQIPSVTHMHIKPIQNAAIAGNFPPLSFTEASDNRKPVKEHAAYRR